MEKRITGFGSGLGENDDVRALLNIEVGTCPGYNLYVIRIADVLLIFPDDLNSSASYFAIGLDEAYGGASSVKISRAGLF